MGVIAVIVAEGESIVFQVEGQGVRPARFFVSGKGWLRQETDKDQDDCKKTLRFHIMEALHLNLIKKTAGSFLMMRFSQFSGSLPGISS